MSKGGLQTTRTADRLVPLRAANPALTIPATPDSVDEMTLSAAWLVMRKRRRFVLAFLLAALCAAGAYSLLATPRYEAAARIAINPDGTDSLNLDLAGASLVPKDSTTRLETEVRILQSDSLGLQVLKELHIDRKQLLTGNASGKYVSEMSPRQQARLLSTYQTNLYVKVVPKTQVIEIRFRNPNPELAARVTNSLVSAYVERSFKTKFETARQVSDWLTEQLGGLKENVQRAQERLAQFQRDNGILGADEKNNIITEKLKQLNEELTAAEADRILKQAKYGLASSRNPELMAAVAPASPLQLLRAQQVEIRNQYTQASARFGANYPKVTELKAQLTQVDRQINTEVNNVAERIANEYRVAQKTEDMLRARFDQQKQKAYELNGSAVQYGLLKREVDSSRELYEGLLKKLKEAGISAGLRSTNINVVDAANIPAEPVEPKLAENLGLALLGGLAGGIMLAFVLESLDDSVQTAEESEAVSALPSLGIIPKFKMSSNGHTRHARLCAPAESCNGSLPVLAMARPNSQAAESYRALRSSLLLSAATPPKVVVVTSSLPQEGKSMTSVNCAVVLAQKGGRVLLLDGDIRRPTIHQSLRLPNEPGLTSILLGGDETSAMVRLPQIANLTVIPAGPRCPYPAELLASERMQDLLAKWRQEYDHIIIDTPPVATVTDATVLSAHADAVLIVIRSGQTRKQTLRRTRDVLLRSKARIAGVVVNAVDMNSPEHYGYYGAGGYYGKRNGNGYYYDGPEKN